METIVVKLGGSLINPGKVATDFLSRFKPAILRHLKNFRFVIVCGGGNVCREYNRAAEKLDLAPYGVRPGKCVDDEYIRNVFGLEVTSEKDPGQRKACGCVRSKDIGVYESCLFGCQYCYATSNFERARDNYSRHDKKSPSLLGRFEGSAEDDAILS